MCLVNSLLAHLYNLVAIPDASTLAKAQYLVLFGSVFQRDTISSVSWHQRSDLNVLKDSRADSDDSKKTLPWGAWTTFVLLKVSKSLKVLQIPAPVLASVQQVKGKIHSGEISDFKFMVTVKQQERPSSRLHSHPHFSTKCFFSPLIILPALRWFCRCHSRPEVPLPRWTKQARKQTHAETHKYTAEAPVMAATGQQMVVVCRHCCGKWTCLGQSKRD